MRHAAIVHVPIALSTLGALLAIASAFAKGQNVTLRWLTIVAYLLLAGMAFAASQTGELAEDALKANLASAARDVIHEHEESGEKVWFFAIGTAIVLLLAHIPKPAVRIFAAWLGVLATLATASWVANTAHFGGEAVYEFGAGTPFYKAEQMVVVGPAGTPRDTSAGSATSADPRAEFFATQVLPVIETRCLRCHSGPKPKAGLYQTTVASLLKGGRTGPAIVPGRPDESLMFQRITAKSDDDVMPPDGRLSADQIAAIERWIREGAVGH
jgi:uncharacterized membrane protein